MQTLSPSPVRPAYIRATSIEYDGLAYLRPESTAPMLGRSPSPSLRGPSRSPSPYIDTLDSLVPQDIQRRAAARSEPNLYLDEAAPDAFERLGVAEPDPVGGRSRLNTICIHLTASLLMVIFPALIIYGAFSIVKKNS